MKAAALLLLSACIVCAEDARSLVARAVATDDRSYRLALNYTYKMRDEVDDLDESGAVKSVHSSLDEVLYIGGRRYFRPLAKDGKPIPAGEAQKEQAKLDRAAAEAGGLSQTDHAKRLAEEEQQIAKRRAQFKDIPWAFDYRMLGDDVVEGRGAWKISASPRPEYHGQLSSILHNLQGTLWIDKQDCSWVKFEADVLHPFSFGFFLARVAEGTHLSYELMPVGTPGKDAFWVPKDISLRATARFALVRKVSVEQKITFSDYRRFQTDARIVSTDE